MRVGYFAANYGVVDDPQYMEIDRLMHHTGHNTGNLAFWYASNLLFKKSIERVLVGWSDTAESLRNKIDILFIPAANFLNETADLEAQARLIEGLDVPVVLIGIGAQSETKSKIVKLKKGTQRFLSVISERTPFICVRGNYSAEVCKHYGINNIVSAGCPSILINPKKDLGQVIEKKFSDPIANVLVHGCCLKGPLVKTETILMKIIEQYKGKYVVQRPPELIKVIFDMDLSEEERSYFVKFYEHIAKHKTTDEFVQFLRQYGESYMSVPEWLLRMRGFRHAIGTRIHGTLLPLAAEVAAVCIHQDTRTEELSETLKIPRINYKNFEKINTDFIKNIRNPINLSNTFREVKFDAREFDENRRRLAGIYSSLFEKINLPSSKHLDDFIL